MVSTDLNITGTIMQKMPQASEQIDTSRKNSTEQPENAQENINKKTLQPEELLKQIKALTDNGAYSVRFEADDRTRKLVVKVVDTATQKVIRQIPPEELLGINQALTQYEGNFVNTKS